MDNDRALSYHAVMRGFFLLAWCFCSLGLGTAQALTLVWDYTYDTGGFFTPDKRDILDVVASRLSAVSINSTEIAPETGNSWEWLFLDPSSGNLTSVANPVAPAGELRVFVGARTLSGDALAQSSHVVYTANGSPSWLDSLAARNTAQAFLPFAGGMAFDAATNWYTGVSPSVTPGAYDFYSVAAHELGHILGFNSPGIAAWVAQSDQPQRLYVGVNATASYGGSIPLDSGLSHWAAGTRFNGHDMLMVPDIPLGVRNDWTDPEFGVFRDLGYAVIPEPVAALLFLGGMLSSALRTRRRAW